MSAAICLVSTGGALGVCDPQPSAVACIELSSFYVDYTTYMTNVPERPIAMLLMRWQPVTPLSLGLR